MGGGRASNVAEKATTCLGVGEGQMYQRSWVTPGGGKDPTSLPVAASGLVPKSADLTCAAKTKELAKAAITSFLASQGRMESCHSQARHIPWARVT